MGGSGGSSVAACDAPNMVFKKTCLGAACHQGIFAPKLTADDPSSELIGKPAVQTDCMGMNLVEPNSNPPAGVLIKRITGGDCGDQMPLSATALTQEQINCVNSWLASKLSP